MARSIKPATQDDVKRVSEAKILLSAARDLLKAAGCTVATNKVRRAIDSADGAFRHVKHRAARAI